MTQKPTPWGKIIFILWLSAAVMALFIWKYNASKPQSANEELAHVPPILEPIYNVLGVEMWLVFGAVAALLFAVGGIKALTGKNEFDDDE